VIAAARSRSGIPGTACLCCMCMVRRSKVERQRQEDKKYTRDETCACVICVH
jgi:hypothetical protein